MRGSVKECGGCSKPSNEQRESNKREERQGQEQEQARDREQASRGKKKNDETGRPSGFKGNGHKSTTGLGPGTNDENGFVRSPGFPRGILRGLGSRLEQRLGMCEINVKVNKQSRCDSPNRRKRLGMSLPYRRGLALEMDGPKPWRCYDKVQGPSGAHCTHACPLGLPLASHWLESPPTGRQNRAVSSNA